ncbi:hypothetical protein ANN_22305 [Periplaneta americana]|uniref:Uncharacterized protein n=1 Tax=Periplaneta americana TaxID=6978 RepID=A0ABQ8S886_PERAM|nr:hypothetical protein ANN_22305 [Periplaneta americana]
MSPGSSTESYPAFAHLGLRENPGKNLNQVTCPDRESNPGHLISRPDALTVTPQFRALSSGSSVDDGTLPAGPRKDGSPVNVGFTIAVECPSDLYNHRIQGLQ